LLPTIRLGFGSLRTQRGLCRGVMRGETREQG
jgi:hypothetical protein